MNTRTTRASAAKTATARSQSKEPAKPKPRTPRESSAAEKKKTAPVEKKQAIKQEEAPSKRTSSRDPKPAEPQKRGRSSKKVEEEKEEMKAPPAKRADSKKAEPKKQEPKKADPKPAPKKPQKEAAKPKQVKEPSKSRGRQATSEVKMEEPVEIIAVKTTTRMNRKKSKQEDSEMKEEQAPATADKPKVKQEPKPQEQKETKPEPVAALPQIDSGMSYLDFVSQIQRELTSSGAEATQFGYKTGSAVGLGTYIKNQELPEAFKKPVAAEAKQAPNQQNSLLHGQQEAKEFYNRQEAFNRYGIKGPAAKQEEVKQEKKAAFGGVIFAKGQEDTDAAEQKKAQKQLNGVKAKELGDFQDGASQGYLPVRLPFVKEEPAEVEAKKIVKKESTPAPIQKRFSLEDAREDMSIHNFFTKANADGRMEAKESSEPVFIQMPSKLPFKVVADQQLKQLAKIGKLRFMKSGKVILRIEGSEGHTDLDVSEGISSKFYQEVAAVRRGRDGSASLSFLGHVKEKLVVTPQIDLD